MASRGQGMAGGRGNREREDRGKHLMVDPDPIREPMEEMFEERELAPIIMAQPTLPPRPINVGEGSSGRKRKRKTGNKENYEVVKAKTTDNHYLRHAWFKWFAENVEHKKTFRRYNTLETMMGVRRFVEHLCELGRQTIRKESYGSVYRVGFRDVALGKELGMEGMVSYVAMKCDAVGTNSAWMMMHKKLASFAETHCAIVQLIACHNTEAYVGNETRRYENWLKKVLSSVQSASITKQQTCMLWACLPRRFVGTSLRI
ncbi:hypothetical protein R1sor_006036 [Riccia sorocarpa]|uniref:Uncharacterized protein n=1 Tax=Riccia sorocarpa TaxID=122646 RepID=A0ABD3HL88_9MARC